MTADNEVSNIWKAMHTEKGDLEDRCEKYARWTLPNLCSTDHSHNSEQMTSFITIGPRIVNSLANKIVETMFPLTRPFFSINLHPKVIKELRKELGKEDLATFVASAKEETRFQENQSMREFDLVAYRPIAVDTAKHLIVSGQALIRRLPDKSRCVYNVQDFGVRRNISGEELEVVVRDKVLADELDEDILEKVKQIKPNIEKRSGIGSTAANLETKDFTLFTRWYWDENKWKEEQEIEGIALDNNTTYSDKDRPFIVPVWSLERGSNYARGLVEEYANVFHNLDVTSEALFDIWQLSADIKFLVNPNSLLDISDLNSSRRGSYHIGAQGDVANTQINNVKEMQQLEVSVQRMERELSLAFLLGSGGVRDAERVTKFEVQLNALELEQAFGGLYSRLAKSWQQREADFLLSNLELPKIEGIGVEVFDIIITTGMENLSREGNLQNFREAAQDLQLLEAIPESIRGVIDPKKVAKFLFGQRGVNFDEFLLSDEDLQAQQQQAQEAQQQQVQQAAAADAAQRTGTPNG